MILKNQKGFALVLISALLPALLAGFLLSFSLLGLLQKDLGLKHTCRAQNLQGQQQVSRLLSALLGLNPSALKLKAEYLQAQAKLAVAIAAANPVAITKAEEHLLRVQERRGQLDARQRQLIKQSNLILSRTFQTTKRLLSQNQNSANLFLKAQVMSVWGHSPKLAVRPDSVDLAPTYSPSNDFETEQALVHEWQYHYEVQAPFSKILSGSFTLKKACAVTLTPEVSSWTPKISKVRHSLKSVW